MCAMTLSLPLSCLFFACHRRKHSEGGYQLQPIHKIVLGWTRTRDETTSWAGIMLKDMSLRVRRPWVGQGAYSSIYHYGALRMVNNSQLYVRKVCWQGFHCCCCCCCCRCCGGGCYHRGRCRCSPHSNDNSSLWSSPWGRSRPRRRGIHW